MKGGFYIIAFAALLHIPWAVVLLFNPEIHLATPIAAYFWLFSQPWQVAMMLLVVSFLAMFGHWRYPTGWRGLLCLMPQQLILMLSAAASIRAISLGRYADGYFAARDFIFNDQWGNILAMLLHGYYVAAVFSSIYAHSIGVCPVDNRTPCTRFQ